MSKIPKDLPEWYIFALAFLSGYLLFYVVAIVQRPFLVASDGPFQWFLRRHVPVIGNHFWPTWWCIESRAQTLLARIIRTRLLPDVSYRREILSLADGGRVALDWLEPPNSSQESPIVVILPGLLGDSQAEYVKSLALTIGSMGLKAVVFNYRGLAGVALETARLYCASSYEDLSDVLNHVGRVNPGVKIIAAGISMGGIILGNYLVRKTDESRSILTAAFMISLPWNMHKGLESIERPILNRTLNRHLAAGLCRLVSRHGVLWGEQFSWNMEEVVVSKSIRDFDVRFTSKHFGFVDLDSYYAYATLHDKLHWIQVPTLCLSAADDPFQPLEAIPIAEAASSSHVAIVLTARGGHIGFLEGFWPFRKDQFMSRLFCQFARSILFTADEEFCDTSRLMMKHYRMIAKRNY